MRELKETEDGTYVVHGSAQLVQSLLDADLVDQLNLMVFPVVLGGGKRLFGPTGDKKQFQLAEARTVDDNVLILVYRTRPRPSPARTGASRAAGPPGSASGTTPVRQARQSDDSGRAVAHWRPSSEM